MPFEQETSDQIVTILTETLKAGKGNTIRAAQHLLDNITDFPVQITPDVAEEILKDASITKALVAATIDAHPVFFTGMRDAQVAVQVRNALFYIFKRFW